MKIKIFALLIVVCLSFLSLASCGGDENVNNNNNNVGDGTNGGGECKHTFSEAWSSNSTQHWHQATCEHGENKDALTDHTDVNQDGFCDVCEYEVGHTHSFSSDWSFDDDYHWKAAICVHTDEQSEIDLHSDDDDNGECDVCGGHIHIQGSSGFCKFEGCGKPMGDIDESDFETIINAVVNQSGLVNGVEIEYIQQISSNNKDYQSDGHWLSYNRTTKQNIHVLFGKNGYVNSFIESQTVTGLGSHQNTTNSTFESWHEKDGSTAFGVVSENGATPVIASADIDQLYGNLYTLSTVASGYGTENFLYSIYEASQSGNARDLVVVFADDENKVSFSFNLLVVHEIIGNDIDTSGDQVQKGESTTTYNVAYFEIEASFSYDENYVLTSFEATCKSYTNNAGQLADKSPNLKDVNLRYNPETGTFEFVKYIESDNNYVAVDKSEVNPAFYSYSITQTAGERTAKNEHPKSSFIPASFDLFTDPEHTTMLESSVTVKNREFLFIYLGNYQPEGTSIDFVYDLISYDILDSKGNVLQGTDIMEGNSDKFKASLTFGAEEGRYFMLFPLKTGNYTFVINYQGSVAYSIAITVN